MKASELNGSLRAMFNLLIGKNYKKNHMCEVTLGASANPQFDGFVKGQDLGVVPLTRMVEGLGYELHLVAIKKDDPFINTINAHTSTFIEQSQENLENFLKGKTGSRMDQKTRDEFVTQVEDIMRDLGL